MQNRMSRQTASGPARCRRIGGASVAQARHAQGTASVGQVLRELESSSHRLGLLALFAAFALMACVLFVNPASAFAKGYDMPAVRIHAQVQPDGSLHVVEDRVFAFSGSLTAVWWTLDNLPGALEVKGVSVSAELTEDEAVALADAPGEGSLTPLDSVTFETRWRDSGGPSAPAYSVDLAKSTVYAFIPSDDSARVFRLDYVVQNAAVAYKDTADLYWKYLGAGWAEDSSDVTCTIYLPAPEGASGVPGDTVLAWGHGPLSGSVAIDDAGTAVAYAVPRVRSGQFAEAHVLFPTEWLTDLPKDAQQNLGTLHKESVIEQERKWADEASYQRMASLALIIVLVLVSLALIAWAVRMHYKHGRDPKPAFTDQYWRDVPAPGVHPLVMSRLWNGSLDNGRDVVAHIMHLVNEGVLSMSVIAADEQPKPEGLLGKLGSLFHDSASDYRLALERPELLGATDARAHGLEEVDLKLIELLFEGVADGERALTLDEVAAFAKRDPKRFNALLSAWRGAVEALYNQEGYEKDTKAKSTKLLTVGILYAVASFGLTVVMDNFLFLAVMIPASAVLCLFVGLMRCKTQLGADVRARCGALRAWLKDFTAIDERPALDIKVWGAFMVYAQMFGVAKEVAEQLKGIVPLPADDDFDGYRSGLPVVYWWGAPGFGHSAGPSVGDSFADALSSSFANASETVASALSSSGSGGGGGFSMGGGGGFGGGGGGAR